MTRNPSEELQWSRAVPTGWISKLLGRKRLKTEKEWNFDRPKGVRRAAQIKLKLP